MSKKILLDFGHSSSKAKKPTPGKRSPYSSHKTLPAIEFFEGDWNREVGRRIYNELKKLGYDVEIVVPEDEDISLTERVRRVNKIARQKGASNCLLISIHANAAGSRGQWLNARGFQIHVSNNASKNSKKLADYIFDEAEKKGLKVRKPLPNQKYWENNFYILKNTSCPAVLSESGFYDNIEDCTYLVSEEGKQEITDLHVQGIINYIKENENKK
jgi:N-acetylmuramoyl-L-alanine amidase